MVSHVRWAFVLQLGPETRAAERQFTGRIEEVDTGREVRFRSTDELLAFLAECAEPRMTERRSQDSARKDKEP
jgi:hypothetical protein